MISRANHATARCCCGSRPKRTWRSTPSGAGYLTRRALEFDPDNPEAVVKLGRVLRTIGRNEEALEFFQRYHQMVPGDFLGLAHIGSCLSAMGRYQEAESYLRRAVAGIDDPQTHYNLGLLLAITNRTSDAIAEYEKALARDPMHADARLNMATALARQGKMDQAWRELTRLVDQDPDNAVAAHQSRGRPSAVGEGRAGSGSARGARFGSTRISERRARRCSQVKESDLSPL